MQAGQQHAFESESRCEGRSAGGNGARLCCQARRLPTGRYRGPEILLQDRGNRHPDGFVNFVNNVNFGGFRAKTAVSAAVPPRAGRFCRTSEPAGAIWPHHGCPCRPAAPGRLAAGCREVRCCAAGDHGVRSHGAAAEAHEGIQDVGDPGSGMARGCSRVSLKTRPSLRVCGCDAPVAHDGQDGLVSLFPGFLAGPVHILAKGRKNPDDVLHDRVNASTGHRSNGGTTLSPRLASQRLSWPSGSVSGHPEQVLASRSACKRWTAERASGWPPAACGQPGAAWPSWGLAGHPWTGQGRHGRKAVGRQKHTAGGGDEALGDGDGQRRLGRGWRRRQPASGNRTGIKANKRSADDKQCQAPLRAAWPASRAQC